MNAEFWKRKLAAYLHDPPEKVLDLAWHKRRAEDYEKGILSEAAPFARDCDHTAAAADRLPWPRWQFLESAFDGKANFFKHPLGGKTADGQPAGFRINPYSHADIAHHFASLNRPQLTQGDDRAQFFAFWRLWRWWASDNKDSRLAFLPADTRLPDHTIWVHNAIVSALQACVTGEGKDAQCRPAFLLFQIGPVQEYIAQARRTLDLWCGSYLLSYLIGSGLKHIALNHGPDCVIFPNLCGQPIFDLLLKDDIWTQARVQTPESKSEQTLWDCFGYDTDYGRLRLLIPSLPNRFLAVLPANEATRVACEVERAIRDTHAAIADAVWRWARDNLNEAACWTDDHKRRFDAQNDRFLEVAWQVVEWPLFPDEAKTLAACLPSDKDYKPLEGLETILEVARRQPPPTNHRTVPPSDDDHRDVRNFECERFPEGTRNAQGRDISGWKDRSKLKPDARLDNPGAAWSTLYQLVDWQLAAVRQTRAWKAWDPAIRKDPKSRNRWEVGREQNKDSLNGKEEALLDLCGPDYDEARVERLNEQAGIPNLFKPGELLGASTLIKRLWPTAWLQEKHGFKNHDWRMPDTRHIADGQPFARSETDKDFDAHAERAEDRDADKYFAVLALDGDEVGKWVSGLHPKMPTLGDQLSDYTDPQDRQRKGARKYFEDHGLQDLLDRKRPLTPSFHLQFSEMLANFGNFCVRRIVEAYDGRLIYSGGDDVVALLPAHQAIPCARALRAAFRGDPNVLNQLSGAWQRCRENGDWQWRKEDKRLFQFEEHGFIKLHPEALCLEGEPKRFHAIVPGPAADCSVGIAIAHFKDPLQDVVRAAQAAEKRAKKQLGRSAVAVTLMKRSGETIEWGCLWDSGGLELYDAMLRAVAQGAVSRKFPHRVVELLDGYLIQTTPLAATAVQVVEGFPTLDVIAREFQHALDRQGQRKESPAFQALAGQAADLGCYLATTKPDRSDPSDPSVTIEAPLRALIGLCQTVAFIARNSPDESDAQTQSAIRNPRSAIHQPAERQPVS